MRMMDQIRAKRDKIYAIAKRHKAEKLWVFGSCARKEERPDSDVDFLEDMRLQDASAFDISTIGEAAAHVSEEFQQAHPEIPWIKMRGIRNRLVHIFDYGQIDYDILCWPGLMSVSVGCITNFLLMK